MGLEIRKGRNGKTIPHWYGRYTDRNGIRRVVALTEPMPSKGIPDSLKDAGNRLFESSRARAEKELEVYINEAAIIGKANHLAERLIQSKIGSSISYAKIADLSELWKSIERDDTPSDNHLRWCESVFNRFADCVQREYLHEVTKSDVKKFMYEIKKTLAPDTARRIRALIDSAFKRFIPEGAINPFEKKIGNKGKKQEKSEYIDRRALTPDEINRLFETALKTDHLLYELAVTATLTGLRIGDVCTLKWESIDWKDGGWIELNTSKTGTGVSIPIWPRLQEVLEARLSEHKQEEPYVFPKAAKMYNGITEIRMVDGKPKGGWDTRKKIYYRGKKLFALAFCDTAPRDRVSTNRIELSDILPEALEAVKVAQMAESKRERIIKVIKLYVSGKSYTEIRDITRLSKGQISDYLREVEVLTGWIFRIGANRRQDLKTLMNGTRKNRKIGKNAVSTLGWHNLKTTFITLALANNLPIETIKKITGNSDLETIRKHYFKPRREHLKAVLGDTLPSIITGNGNKSLPAPEAKPDISGLAAQLANLTKSERAKLNELMNMKPHL